MSLESVDFMGQSNGVDLDSFGGRWYYDACVLDANKRVYTEISKNLEEKNICAVTGHLGLGEAHTNVLHKKGREEATALIDLLHNLNEAGHFFLVNHDDITEILQQIRTKFNNLSLSDAIHLATAIYNKCEVLRTKDRDLWGIPHDKIKLFAKQYDINNFEIKQWIDIDFCSPHKKFSKLRN